MTETDFVAGVGGVEGSGVKWSGVDQSGAERVEILSDRDCRFPLIQGSMWNFNREPQKWFADTHPYLNDVHQRVSNLSS